MTAGCPSLAVSPGGYSGSPPRRAIGVLRTGGDGREALRGTGDAARGPGAALRPGPVHRRYSATRSTQRLLRAEPTRPRQNPVDRRATRIGDARRSRGADGRRSAGADAHRAHPDDAAGGRQSHDADPALSRARRGELRWPSDRGCHRRQPRSRRGCSRDGCHRLRRAAVIERCPRRGGAGRGAGPFRHSEQHRTGGAYRLRRCRWRLLARGACVRGRNLGASRRRHGYGDARGRGEPRSRDRHAHRVVVDADAASRPPYAR